MSKRKPNFNDSNDRKPDSNSYSSEQKRIWKRIRKLSRRIESLKARHNALAPINRLPPELFVKIILALQSEYIQSSPSSYYNWTVVTHVSRSWRTLALETKLVWASVVQVNQPCPWLEVFLARSDPLGLDVVVDLSQDEDRTIHLRALRAENRRIRSLNVTAASEMGEGRGIILSLLAAKMPILEKFNLVGADTIPDTPLAFTNLFNSFAPFLGSLQISKFNISLPSLTFRNLTVLRLDYEKGYDGVLSLRALFTFLLTAQLVTLDLRHAIRESRSDRLIDTKFQPIHLPSLSILQLRLPAHQCIKILSYIIPPDSCRMFLWGYDTDHHNIVPVTRVQDFHNSVTSIVSLDYTKFTNLMFWVESGGLFWQGCQAADMQPGDWMEPPKLRFGFIPSGRDSDWFSFPSLAACSQVRWIRIQGSLIDDARPHVGEFMSMLWTLPSLQELEIAADFLTIFSQQIEANPASFAKLEWLTACCAEKNLGLLRQLEGALSLRKDNFKDGLLHVSLIGAEGWDEQEGVAEMLNQLETVCDFPWEYGDCAFC